MRKTFFGLAGFVGAAFAQGQPPPPNIPPMMRFSCYQLVIDRIDPLVNPGSVPSPHLHQIVGGNSFNETMTHDLVAESTCTTCTFSEDFSNYWTAVLFYRAKNGTFKRVPQHQEIGFPGTGGITIYYIPSSDEKKNGPVTAFKPGFRMLVGDAARRETGPSRKVCHRCMPKSGDLSHLNCAGTDSQALPAAPCVGGIRTVITFPTCWDGKNLDSPDHMSHVTYAAGAGANDVGPTGKCPNSHPVQIPQLMYEVRWQTQEFTELWKSEYPEAGSQPFVWSTGDSKGFSQHGDYMFGWKDDSLQRAMDNRCTGDTCKVLDFQKFEEATKCGVPRLVHEDVDGWLETLPGDMMVT